MSEFLTPTTGVAELSQQLLACDSSSNREGKTMAKKRGERRRGAADVSAAADGKGGTVLVSGVVHAFLSLLRIEESIVTTY